MQPITLTHSDYGTLTIWTRFGRAVALRWDPGSPEEPCNYWLRGRGARTAVKELLKSSNIGWDAATVMLRHGAVVRIS